MALIIRDTRFKQFAACFSGSRYNGIFSSNFNNMLNDFLTHHSVIICIYKVTIIGDCSLTYNKCYTFSNWKYASEVIHGILKFFLSSFLADNKSLNIHIMKQLHSYFTLINVLWFIMNTWLTAPTNYKNHGNCINLII